MFEKSICGNQTRNCHLRQVTHKREGFITARLSFDLVQTLREWQVPSAGWVPLAHLLVRGTRGIDGNSYSSRLGTTRKPLCGDRKSASITVGKDGGRHDLDASVSKGVEYIASQISVDVEDALAGVGPSAQIVFNRIVPKGLFQDFGSWVGNDLFGSAGTLDQKFVYGPPVDVVTDGGSHGHRDTMSPTVSAVICHRAH